MCGCSEMYDPQTVLQAKVRGCAIYLGHKELTSAEVGPSVGIYKPQPLSRANPLEVAIASFTSGQSWEVECFYCILDFAVLLLWWAEHDLSTAPAGAFQGGNPMIAIHPWRVSWLPD